MSICDSNRFLKNATHKENAKNRESFRVLAGKVIFSVRVLESWECLLRDFLFVMNAASYKGRHTDARRRVCGLCWNAVKGLQGQIEGFTFHEN